ncbi:hypothetical protein MASR1M60_04130 [Rhodocyclaceae bacterium]
MAQLDVFRNPDKKSAAVIPFVLDIQNNLLANLPTRTVIPLAVPATVGMLPILRLNPTVSVGEMTLIALTQDMAALPKRMLTTPITNLSPQREEILAALDFLFTGF